MLIVPSVEPLRHMSFGIGTRAMLGRKVAWKLCSALATGTDSSPSVEQAPIRAGAEASAQRVIKRLIMDFLLTGDVAGTIRPSYFVVIFQANPPDRRPTIEE